MSAQEYPDYEGMLAYWDEVDQQVAKIPNYGPFAIVEPSARLGSNVYVGPFTHVMANSKVGDNATLEGCYIEGARIGNRVRVYRGAHIMMDAIIGDDALIGGNCFIADGAIIGARTRLMLNVGIGRCTRIGDDVYLGPNVVFANSNPRDGLILPVEVGDGAIIGTNAVSTHNVRRIGRYAIVGAGSVVTRNVPDYAVVAGNPAKLLRWNTIDGEYPEREPV